MFGFVARVSKTDSNDKLVSGNICSILHITIGTLYERLYQEYGDTGWWPADSRDEVIIGTILTQNTSWKNVELSLGKMRKNSLTTLQAISTVDQAQLTELIRSSGFYNQKSERLIHISKEITKNYTSVEKMMESDPEELINFLGPMKGIGQETLDSILLYALDKPVFVVDKYTVRILSRIGIKVIGQIDPIKSLVHEYLGTDISMLKNLHGMIVYLAKDYCRVKPKCGGCPVKNVCDFGLRLDEL